MKRFCLGSILLATTIFCVAAPVTKMMNGVLVNASGMTLYTFDMDASGKSKCNGPCATLWPAAIASDDAKPDGELSIIMRDDGSKQWAYKGKPVYTFSKDGQVGDMTGDNVKNVWHVIK
jgi:predicted lipoprotein with Yx(FWY)xxD motif